MRYPPVGRCIYCGPSAVGELTKEHVIPLGLNGNLILPKASCKRCATITGTVVEGPCLRRILIGPRTHWRLKSRRPKERPTELPVGVGVPEENFEWINLKIPDHPLAFGIPIIDRPGFVRRSLLRREIGLLGFWSYIEPTAEAKLNSLPPVAGIYQPTNLHLFCRMIAKIAHAYAVAKEGLDSFVPFLPDIILGKSEFVSHYVGRANEQASQPPPSIQVELTHYLELRPLKSPEGDVVISVLVQLFASLGAPIFEVIVGRPVR